MNEPSPCLDIVVADAGLAWATACLEALARDGHRVLHARNSRQIAELCRVATPNFVITDIHLPDGPALPTLAEATRDRRVPVVVVATDLTADALAAARDLPVEAALTKPVTPAALRAAVARAVRRFALDEALRAEVADLRQALEDRKLVERAKGIVCRRLGLDEQEAFRSLRKLSNDKNRELADVARRVIDCDEVFAELELAADPAPRDGRRRPRHNGNGAAGHGRGAWPAGSGERVAERANEAAG